MKCVYLTAFYLAATIVVTAQPTTGTAITTKSDAGHFQFTPSVRPKIVVYFYHDSLLKGNLIEINDLNLLLLIKDEMGNSKENSVSIPKIQSIKVKRDKFWTGAALGAVFGALLGYALGSGSYHYDHSLSERNNSEQQSVRGYSWAAIAAIPSAVVGSLVSTFFVRTTFLINGNKKNAERMASKLSKF